MEGHGDPNYHAGRAHEAQQINNIEMHEMAELSINGDDPAHYIDDDVDIQQKMFEKNIANHSVKYPQCRLCFATTLLFICVIVTGSCYIFKNMIHVIGFFGSDGKEMWKYGWYDREFIHINDDFITSNVYKSGEVSIPCIYAGRYFEMIKRVTMYSLILMFIGVLYIYYVMFIRNVYNSNAVVNLCCIKIPQRTSVLSVFHAFGWISTNIVFGWAFLGLWAEIEMKSYVNAHCSAYMLTQADQRCQAYFLPHWGFCSMVIVPFIIGCLAERPVKALGLPFAKEAIAYYYPLNEDTSKERTCPIVLKKLLSAINSTKTLIIYLMIFSCFEEAGLINIWVLLSGDFSLGQLFNISGTVQSHGLILNKGYSKDKPYGKQWFRIGKSLYYYTLGLIIINIGIIIYYSIVLQTYKRREFNKFMICFISFFQWFIFNLFIGLYGYNFYLYWIDGDGKSKVSIDPRVEGPIINPSIYTPAPTTQLLPDFLEVQSIYILPDWGIFIILIIEYYMIKQFYQTFKSM